MLLNAAQMSAINETLIYAQARLMTRGCGMASELISVVSVSRPLIFGPWSCSLYPTKYEVPSHFLFMLAWAAWPSWKLRLLCATEVHVGNSNTAIKVWTPVTRQHELNPTDDSSLDGNQMQHIEHINLRGAFFIISRSFVPWPQIAYERLKIPKDWTAKMLHVPKVMLKLIL